MSWVQTCATVRSERSMLSHRSHRSPTFIIMKRIIYNEYIYTYIIYKCSKACDRYDCIGYKPTELRVVAGALAFFAEWQRGHLRDAPKC